MNPQVSGFRVFKSLLNNRHNNHCCAVIRTKEMDADASFFCETPLAHRVILLHVFHIVCRGAAGYTTGAWPQRPAGIIVVYGFLNTPTTVSVWWLFYCRGVIDVSQDCFACYLYVVVYLHCICTNAV